ncbi:hypothetical protein KP509_25G043200 [Ceratopteris richardii]|uniref:Helicase ATP-binding domain-containing protein n=1 Tax=Ceratopteris richardii TaxID=49495 RepID=A0A8T2RSE6_CERRI|nr:hypothetical protein KP509_25G043200 [Ceratopteris richardii]
MVAHVDSRFCSILPSKILLNKDIAQGVLFPGSLGFHFKFSPAAASLSVTKAPQFSFHTGDRRRDTTVGSALREQTEAVADIPSLPFSTKYSITVQNWGSLYKGPHEDKYWNSNKKYPYTIGYTCLKSYRGKTYVQKIKEGAEGPLFVVEVVGEDKVFSSDSPQRVWNHVVEQDGQSVKGARHFGFESHDVLKALQSLYHLHDTHSSKKAIDQEDAEFNMSTSLGDKLFSEDIKAETHSDFSLVENLFDMEIDDDEDDKLDAFREEREEGENSDDDDDIATEVINIGAEGGEEYNENEGEKDDKDVDEDDDVENGLLHDVMDHHIDVHHDDDLESDDDDDEAEHEEEDEEEEEGLEDEVDDDNGRSHLSYDVQRIRRRVHDDDDDDNTPTFDNASPLIDQFKSSSRSIRRAMNFERFQQIDSVDDPYKDDIEVSSNDIYYPTDQNRSKLVGRVWRKGDRLLGGKQQGLDKAASDHRYLSNDGSPTAPAAIASNSMRSWDGSFTGKKREENSKSSQMLLELLQSWKRSRKWIRESRSRMHNATQNKSMQIRREENEYRQDSGWGHERASLSPSKSGFQGHYSESSPFASRGNIMLKIYESPELMQASQISSETGGLALDEINIADDIDESTDYAVGKLFEIIGGKEIQADAPRVGNIFERGQQIIVNAEKRWSRQGIGRTSDIGDYKTRMVSEDDSRRPGVFVGHTKEKDHEEIEPPKIIEKLVVDGGASAIFKEMDLGSSPVQLVHRGTPIFNPKQKDRMRLTENIRRLVGTNCYEDALLALKSARASNMDLDVDVYEAFLGDIRLDTWQKEVFELVQDGNSVLVSAPSGAGKSTSADCCILRNYIEEHRTLFVTPSEDLAKVNVYALGTTYGNHNVGGTGTMIQKDHKVVVLTLESLAKMLQELHGPGGSEFRFFFEGINMVVFDKFHTFGEFKYVNMWEEVFMLMDARIKVLALTLPASNEDQIVSWIGTHRGTCKLVRQRTQRVMKRYLFYHGSHLSPLFDAGGVKVNEGLVKINKAYKNSMTKEYLDSALLSGYDKLSLNQAVVSLRENFMLPAIVVFFNITGCNEAIQDAFMSIEGSLLSDQDLAKLEALCIGFKETHRDLWDHLDHTDREALKKGFAACHEGKLPAWRNFVGKLFKQNILKLLIATDNSALDTGFMARTLVLPSIIKVAKNGVFLLSATQALPLFGIAGRSGYDIEGNVVFLQNLHAGPNEAASLVLQNELDIVSMYKPSYSLVVNLMAKYHLSKVKHLLSSTLHDTVFYNTHGKRKLLDEMGQEIVDCLEIKGDQEVKLFQGLAEVNKKKLADAAMFTRVDIRLSIHSASHGGNVLPGFLLAVVPEQADSFYMVFGADNNFHLVPAGALDHVYTQESPPLDVLHKQTTGQILQPPPVPPKENWTVEHGGTYGYMAAGDMRTQQYVKLLMDYPTQVTAVREGLQLRKEILSLDLKISSLVEKRRNLHGRNLGNGKLSISNKMATGLSHGSDESETWKEALRLVKVLEQAGALSLTESQGAYVKLKPLGMLISRLHNAENELWLALVLTLSHAKQLPPGEFISIIAATIPLEKDMENLFDSQRNFIYRSTRPLKDAFTKLEILRKQVAAMQGSFSPPLHFCTEFAGMMYAWARGKPGSVGYNLEKTNDGEMAWRVKSMVKHANMISRACTQVSVDISEPNDFSSLSVLARKAEELLLRHLNTVD